MIYLPIFFMSEAPSYPLHPRSNKTAERLGRRIDAARSNPESMPGRRRKTDTIPTPQETPLTSLDLLAQKLLSLEGDKVQREKLRKDIADAEGLLERLKQEHAPNIVAVYDKELRINERLGIARHLADVYEQIASWGEAARLETHLEEGGEIIDPHPLDAREEALMRHEREKELRKQYAAAEKTRKQMKEGRKDEADEEAQATKGLETDDLTLSYEERANFALSKIKNRFYKIKNRVPTDEELDKLTRGQVQAGGYPLSLGERLGQRLRRMSELTLGKVFDRFSDTSLTQAIADYKKLEDTYHAAKDASKKLEEELTGRETYRTLIQERAKNIDPRQQQEEAERVRARLKMKAPSLKEVASGGRNLTKEEQRLERARRILARNKLNELDQELEKDILATYGDDGKAKIKEVRARQKVAVADSEEGDRAAAEAFKRAGTNRLVEARLAEWRAAQPSAPDATTQAEATEHGQTWREAEEKERIRIRKDIEEARQEILGPTPAKDAPESEKKRRRQAEEDLFFKEENLFKDETGLAVSSETSTEAERVSERVTRFALETAANIGNKLPENASRISLIKGMLPALERVQPHSDKVLEEALNTFRGKLAAYVGMLNKPDLSPDARLKYTHLKDVLDLLLELAPKTPEQRQTALKELETVVWERTRPRTVEEMANAKSLEVSQDDLNALLEAGGLGKPREEVSLTPAKQLDPDDVQEGVNELIRQTREQVAAEEMLKDLREADLREDAFRAQLEALKAARPPRISHFPSKKVGELSLRSKGATLQQGEVILQKEAARTLEAGNAAREAAEERTKRQREADGISFLFKEFSGAAKWNITNSQDAERQAQDIISDMKSAGFTLHEIHESVANIGLRESTSWREQETRKGSGDRVRRGATNKLAMTAALDALLTEEGSTRYSSPSVEEGRISGEYAISEKNLPLAEDVKSCFHPEDYQTMSEELLHDIESALRTPSTKQAILDLMEMPAASDAETVLHTFLATYTLYQLLDPDRAPVTWKKIADQVERFSAVVDSKTVLHALNADKEYPRAVNELVDRIYQGEQPEQESVPDKQAA